MSSLSPIMATPEQRAAHAPEFASILIVDDEDFDRSNLKNLCRKFNFTTQVVEADSLAGMQKALTKDRFDLVLIDYHLTDGTGLEGVEIIRADPVNCHAATVMITGTDQSDIALQALKSGFSDYLTKDELSAQTLARSAIVSLQKSQMLRGLIAQAAPPLPMNGTAQRFSRAYAKDIKPVVSSIMRQMRSLREIGQIKPEDATVRLAQVEDSLRRLWEFLDDLDHVDTDAGSTGPTVSATRNSDLPVSAGLRARVPTEQPKKRRVAPPKPPSIFRR
jgi:CheY-like chemotaxis protein